MMPWKSFFSLSLMVIVGAAPIQAAKYKTIKGGVKNGGTLSGRIIFDGVPPSPKMLNVNKDKEACGENRPSEELLVDKNGGIANAVVSIIGVKKGKKWNLPKKFKYDQKNCRFIPHVMLVRPSAGGKVLNSDDVGHNFHTVSKGIYNINKKIKPNASMKVKRKKIKKSGTIRVKCDLHTWMGGWWIVAKTPYTELTDGTGSFSIGDIPPGTYQLKVWQEKLGEVEQSLVINSGETQEITVKMSL